MSTQNCNAMKTVFIIIFSIFAILGIVILLGKLDRALGTKEERERCNIKRLRLIWGMDLILFSAGALYALLDDSIDDFWVLCPLLLLNMVANMLANTWAKKKKNYD